MKILPLVLQSLESIASTDYPSDRFKLIVVDNGSTDGSFEKIREFVERRSGLRKKIIKLDRNLGFTGGNNIGFMARDRESKYVLLLNNDAVLLQHGLKTLVEYAEGFSGLAGLQGVVLKYGTRLIDSAGGYVNELLQPYSLGGGREYPWVLRRPVYVTYVSGACALLETGSILRCVGGRPFLSELFGYYDETALSLMLWSCGYRLVAIPEVVATHAGGLTFRKVGTLKAYLLERNRVALTLVTNTRYKHVVILQMLRNLATSIPTGLRALLPTRTRAIVDGLELGRRLRSRGVFINIYRAPVIRIPLKDLVNFFTSRYHVRRYHEEWALRNLEYLAVE
jgi:GT2 family glycosyltransferase